MLNNDLPETTLFMLMSVDGKISTGAHDERDFDKDLPRIPGIGQGLPQYYELERRIDPTLFCTGRTMAKIGWNIATLQPRKIPISFVVSDNRPHLNERGVKNLAQHSDKLFILTSNMNHPALRVDERNIEIISHSKHSDYIHLFHLLKSKGIDFLTIQSGGEMNALLLRLGLINYISIVVAPVLIGGRHTPSLIDGESLRMHNDLQHVKTLELLSVEKLDHSFMHMKYKVN